MGSRIERGARRKALLGQRRTKQDGTESRASAHGSLSKKTCLGLTEEKVLDEGS
jgi:hypothetical protein